MHLKVERYVKKGRFFKECTKGATSLRDLNSYLKDLFVYQNSCFGTHGLFSTNFKVVSHVKKKTRGTS